MVPDDDDWEAKRGRESPETSPTSRRCSVGFKSNASGLGVSVEHKVIKK